MNDDSENLDGLTEEERVHLRRSSVLCIFEGVSNQPLADILSTRFRPHPNLQYDWVCNLPGCRNTVNKDNKNLDDLCLKAAIAQHGRQKSHKAAMNNPNAAPRWYFFFHIRLYELFPRLICQKCNGLYLGALKADTSWNNPDAFEPYIKGTHFNLIGQTSKTIECALCKKQHRDGEISANRHFDTPGKYMVHMERDHPTGEMVLRTPLPPRGDECPMSFGKLQYIYRFFLFQPHSLICINYDNFLELFF